MRVFCRAFLLNSKIIKLFSENQLTQHRGCDIVCLVKVSLCCAGSSSTSRLSCPACQDSSLSYKIHLGTTYNVLLPEDLINKSTIIDFKSICHEVNTLFCLSKIQDTSVFDLYTGVLFHIYVLFVPDVDVNKSNCQGPMALRGRNPCRTPATSRLTRPAWSPRRLAPIPGTATRDVHCKCRTRPWIWGHLLRGELLCEPAFAHANPPVTRGVNWLFFISMENNQ